MIVLHIEGVKEFMEQLFYGDMFDRIHVKDCEVATFTVFRIDDNFKRMNNSARRMCMPQFEAELVKRALFEIGRAHV